ncbi:rhomboid family intramembrane serine protease [uncultured Desulfosarcina sp.]|uniref:rhomboid family intramembrane serine protease n=1 Tax=uncultured Desulfosarcina sp. TaxID=218289 RepID=UPI0029C71B11|nr:rhomboid family intramembrane serine protease [uncultured Desulfosarcina sp.]
MVNGTPSRKSALLCPGCRRLVSVDEPKCPYCGLPAPGSRWKNTVFTRGFSSGEQLINTIIAVNAVMYLLSLLMSNRGLNLSGNPMSFLSPDNQGLLLLGATGAIPIDRLHHWWTLISASYLHGGLLHIVFNMLALRQISPLVIREYGNHRMIIIYTLSGVCGFIVSYLAGVSFTIGASAAVCGLIGAALYYGKSRGGNYGQAVYRQVGGWAISIVLFGLVVPGINNWAHGGGMVAGIFTGLILGYHERKKENMRHRLIGGLCLSGTAAVLLWAVFTGLFYRF